MATTWAFVFLLCLSLYLVITALAARELQLESGHQMLQITKSFKQDNGEFVAAQSLPWTKYSEQNENEDGPSLTLRVMHRDSPLSPFRNPLVKSEELILKERLKRDALRVETLSLRARMASRGLKSSDFSFETASFTAQKDNGAVATGFAGPVVSGLMQGSGEYFTRMGIGTPAQESYMVLDTGSDLLWLQCAPCADCYQQTDPIFNPHASSSYKKLSCLSPMCAQLDLHGCQATTNLCLYQVFYGDGSFTFGEFSMETLSFRGATMKNVALGCGHDNEGLFAGAAGLFGLGGGSLSFPSQMGSQFGKKFSYCLVDRDKKSSSTLIFGNAAVSQGTVFTPLLKNPKLDTFYYVSLTGISVGGSQVTIPASAFKMDNSGNGGVIIDSGTSITRLVETAYGPLRSAFKGATRDLPFAGGFSLFDTCFDLSARTSVKVPTVTLHFEGGADLSLPAANYLIPVDSSGTYCFAFASTAGDLSIIGNVQQQGFRIVFDSLNSRLGFASNQC